MIKILEINYPTVNLLSEELNQQSIVLFSDFILNDFSKDKFKALSININLYCGYFIIYSSYQLVQQLWYEYMTKVMSFDFIKNMAVDLGISTDGKLQNVLAKEIIKKECYLHKSQFLL